MSGEWEAERWGRTWYVTRVNRGVLEYLRGKTCNYGPRGRIMSFRSGESAQRRADVLNLANESGTGEAS